MRRKKSHLTAVIGEGFVEKVWLKLYLGIGEDGESFHFPFTIKTVNTGIEESRLAGMAGSFF